MINYIKEIKEEIKRYCNYLTNPVNYEKINNPFAAMMTKTYVWIDEDK